MKIHSSTIASVEARVKTRICKGRFQDGRFIPGRIVKERPWEKNLVLDTGLNGLALDATNGQGCAPGSAMVYCMVGDSTVPVKISSGAVTFTQSGTTLTASAGFFTAAMVGGLFKWGTGSAGTENYIASFTNSTTVELVDSEAVAVPEVGVVWQVQQVGLQSFLLQTNTKQTLAGDCQTTYSANAVTHQVTYVFSVQGAPYTVNEIGWNPVSSATRTMGRLVLSSSDVVGTSNFYVVTIAVTYTYGPSAPTAVANVGTNIDTDGTAMLEWFSIATINPSTGEPLVDANEGGLDGFCTVQLIFALATYTQNAAIPSGTTPTLDWGLSLNPVASSIWSKVPAALGKMRATTASSSTTNGETLYGCGLFSRTSPGSSQYLQKPFFDVKFTTPQTAPVGTFQPSFVWEITYGRALTN